MKIVFLDIDGVLLSERALCLPENEIFRAWRASGGRAPDAGLVATEVRFDPCAVSLVNRLCDRTGARLVVHSNWRRVMNAHDLMKKLVGQGLHVRHFHDDWFCGMRLTSHKSHDVAEWISDHRSTPEPHRPFHAIGYSPDPSQTGTWRTEEQALRKETGHHGLHAIAIDDEPLTELVDQVTPSFDDGFALADYRLACALLDGEDPDLGVFELSQDDKERLMEAFVGSRLEMYKWLCQATRNAATRLESLRPAADPSVTEKRRAAIWKQLDEHLAV